MNTNNQTATLPAPNSHSNAKRAYQDKEMIAAWSLIAPAKNGVGLDEVVIARWYASRSRNAANIYCNVWVRGNVWASGHGYAGGGGYDKQSAALQSALESAGIKLSRPIDGRGQGASRGALSAIAEAMGYQKTNGDYLIVEHN